MRKTRQKQNAESKETIFDKGAGIMVRPNASHNKVVDSAEHLDEPRPITQKMLNTNE